MFSQEVADKVCDRLAQGDSLRKAAASVGLTHRTILNWVNSNAAFATQYARAREEGYTLLAEDLMDVADDPEIPSDQKRIMVDTRKWKLSKMLPKIYGDKVIHAGDQDNPIQHVGRIDLVPLGSN